MPYASNNNAVLIDGCNNLRNLSVLCQVTQDIPTTAGSGWSLQLNCYPRAGAAAARPARLIVFQYIVYRTGRESRLLHPVLGARGCLVWPFRLRTPSPDTTPWLPCWAHDYGNRSLHLRKHSTATRCRREIATPDRSSEPTTPAA